MTCNYKGIILAGGYGTRLHPLTFVTSKQLLPVYDKPMIYYPLSVLMMAGISEILIISTVTHLPIYRNLFGSGENLGISIEYLPQDFPEGVPQAFTIAENFIGSNNVALILGDNIFVGEGFQSQLSRAMDKTSGATVFGYHVQDPENYGVVEFNESGKVQSIEEKPTKPKSNYIVTGLYFYDNNVIDYAKSLYKSEREEYEISDLNNIYLKSKNLSVEILGRGFAWLDCGTYEGLADATQLVRTIQNRHGLKIACLEEIAFKKGWLSSNDLIGIIKASKNKDYANYLLQVVNDN